MATQRAKKLVGNRRGGDGAQKLDLACVYKCTDQEKEREGPYKWGKEKRGGARRKIQVWVSETA